MPTPETMKQLFYGIPFEEIPVCLIDVGRNNTKITVVNVLEVGTISSFPSTVLLE